jgi:hypothetical protein
MKSVVAIFYYATVYLINIISSAPTQLVRLYHAPYFILDGGLIVLLSPKVLYLRSHSIGTLPLSYSICISYGA